MTKMDAEFKIDTALVRRLVSTQFPKYRDLPIEPISSSGWDNRIFHLGKDMLIRLPSAAKYGSQAEKEYKWLPKLAPLLPLAIPEPLALGNPGEGYPWKWSVYRYLKGDSAASTPPSDLSEFAKSLAQFLLALQRIDPTGGPLPGRDNFYRGGSLEVYDAETRQAISTLKSRIDTHAALNIWETALATSWQYAPVWVHGDISLGNLLVQNGNLSAVIDFGQLSIGDPACDLAIAWTFFQGKSREIFRSILPFDSGTWARSRAWTLWKALITAAGSTNPNNIESQRCWHIIDQVLKNE